VLGSGLFGRREDGFRLAEINDDVAAFEALDHAGDDVAFFAGVFLVDHLTLGFTQALQHDLLGGLRGDAAGVRRDGGFEVDDVADLSVGLEATRFVDGHLDVVVFDFGDDGLLREHLHAAVFGLDSHHDVSVGELVLLVRRCERELDRFEHHVLWQVLFSGERSDGGDKFVLHVTSVPEQIPLYEQKSGRRPTSETYIFRAAPSIGNGREG
jgi:hypothetical protein